MSCSDARSVRMAITDRVNGSASLRGAAEHQLGEQTRQRQRGYQDRNPCATAGWTAARSASDRPADQAVGGPQQRQDRKPPAKHPRAAFPTPRGRRGFRPLIWSTRFEMNLLALYHGDPALLGIGSKGCAGRDRGYAHPSSHLVRSESDNGHIMGWKCPEACPMVAFDSGEYRVKRGSMALGALIGAHQGR